MGLEPRETGKELVSHLEPGGTHVHEPRSGEIVEGPESRGREEDARFATVVGAGGCGRLTGFVAQKNLTLPIVKVGESDAVGELQDSDKLGHGWEPRV